ncbi:MAG TPA: alpha/beta hydrolase [Syntrophorhabdaceae bacterium]|mgnify:FL=1|jgi:hypothetical protein|nr:alpha/beta hydrolase [Syntrophorhabdaceae bacterium]MDI9562249.1 alpha/beta hydrolase [Pseudomonadota bacterium]HOG39347.1 alpha/beta hydrolase [Syntrophorhabdaceae bacterium]HOS58688.1 alpha/beta hydrolase [Syntrophorhabdaceae bacterium]HQJ94937.1 alpha/beta hydrolase [Syntrophorhabdaceae bacterium]
MIDFKEGTRQMDRPDILSRLFFPRREFCKDSETPKAINYMIKVEDNISIGCRFYPSGSYAPNILYFHGNGETAPDYDYVAPVYSERGINLFVADYRGYGMSDGSPTCSNTIEDAHPVFHGFSAFLHERGYTGKLFVMGRSLGSAPAIEVAYRYQNQLKGLIVESGFASAQNQFMRLAASSLLNEIENPIGFGNDLKIKQVTIPTLIIHGEWDEIIPVSEGRTLYELSASSKKESLFIPQAGHNDLMMRGLESYMDAIERFVKDDRQ